MATYTDSPYKTFTTGAADLAANVRVRIVSNLAVVGGANDNDCVGVTIAPSTVGNPVVVKLWGPGTIFVTAGGAIAANAPLYPAESGAVDDAVSGNPLGFVSAEARASGDVFEAIPVR